MIALTVYKAVVADITEVLNEEEKEVEEDPDDGTASDQVTVPPIILFFWLQKYILPVPVQNASNGVETGFWSPFSDIISSE